MWPNPQVVLTSLLSILNRFHTLFWYFHCWLWTSKYRLRYLLFVKNFQLILICWTEIKFCQNFIKITYEYELINSFFFSLNYDIANKKDLGKWRGVTWVEARATRAKSETEILRNFTSIRSHENAFEIINWNSIDLIFLFSWKINALKRELLPACKAKFKRNTKSCKHMALCIT